MLFMLCYNYFPRDAEFRLFLFCSREARRAAVLGFTRNLMRVFWAQWHPIMSVSSPWVLRSAASRRYMHTIPAIVGGWEDYHFIVCESFDCFTWHARAQRIIRHSPARTRSPEDDTNCVFFTFEITLQSVHLLPMANVYLLMSVRSISSDMSLYYSRTVTYANTDPYFKAAITR